MRILVVRLSSIGDVVHTTPMVAALIEAGHDVAWAVEPPAAPLVSSIMGLGRTLVLPKATAFDWNDRFRIARDLRDWSPEVSIDAQGLWKSAFWTWLSGAPRRIGWVADNRREGASSVMLTETVTVSRDDIHIIDQHNALLAALQMFERGDRRFPYVLPDASVEAAEQMRSSLPKPMALISPGGGWENKLYPAALWGEVASGLSAMNLSPVVLWGPGEEHLADAVVDSSGGKATRAPSTAILDLAALAKASRLFLAADTGPLHIAGAVGAPLVAVFGPTDPARNGPWSPLDEVVRRTPACAPCHKRSCATHDDTMKKIPVSDILAAAERRLASSTDRDMA